MTLGQNNSWGSVFRMAYPYLFPCLQLNPVFLHFGNSFAKVTTMDLCGKC